MKRESNKITFFTGLPRQSWYWLLSIVFFSALLHLVSIVNLDKIAPRTSAIPYPRSEPAKINVKVTKKPKKPQDKEKPEEKDPDAKRLVETPMAPTEAPKDSNRLGAQDHKTEKETKIADQVPRPKAADPGQAGRDSKAQAARKAQNAPQVTEQVKPKTSDVQRESPPQAPNKSMLLSPNGTVAAPRARENKPRNVYESLMPRSEEMAQHVQAGYQDYVSDEAEIGERVDLNTTNFRYLGYFTNIRKAFELVWSYPAEAVQRGLQGEVKVEFTILQDGRLARVRVVTTSGHKILDDAVVEALNLAAPFAPLPEGMKKDRLTVVGSFRYVLTTYAGAM